jgi:hypothetical protein
MSILQSEYEQTLRYSGALIAMLWISNLLNCCGVQMLKQFLNSATSSNASHSRECDDSKDNSNSDSTTFARKATADESFSPTKKMRYKHSLDRAKYLDSGIRYGIRMR